MGPLKGFKIIEFAASPRSVLRDVFADMGAEIIRIDRIGAKPSTDGKARQNVSARVDARWRWISRIRRRPACVLRMCPQVDGIIEGFRPGVMERFAWVRASVCARIRASSTAA